MEENEFITELNAWKEDQNKPFVPPPYVKKVHPHVELTDAQKRFIIEYELGGVCKGIFESEEFWEDSHENDDFYNSYYEAVEKFIEQIKQHLLDTI